MQRLIFKHASIKLGDAAIALATSQEPWAGVVKCSSYDAVAAGCRWPSEGLYYSILLPLGSSADEMFTTDLTKWYEQLRFPSHTIHLVIDDDVPEGEVQL